MSTYDIITVVYESEINMLALQAHSIKKFVKDIGKIIVVNNASTPELVEIVNKRIIDEVIPLYEDLSSKVEIHTVIEMLGKCYPGIGWQSQQILKLMCYKLVESSLTVILDSKSFFIAPCRFNDLIFENKCLRVTSSLLEQYPEDFIFLNNACKLLELNSDQKKDLIDNYKGNWTPFIVWSDTFIECCEYFINLYKQPLQEAFKFEPLETYEFYLLEAFIAKKYGINNYFLNKEIDSLFRLHKSSYEEMSINDINQTANYFLFTGLYNDYEKAVYQIKKIIQDIKRF